MCWRTHSSEDQTQSTTTPSSWTSTQATVSCPQNSISCSDNETSALFCSHNGKCCSMEAKDFCVCFKEYKGSYCEDHDINYLQSQQAKTTISIAVGLSLFMVVIVALVVFVVVLRMKRRNQNRRQTEAVDGRNPVMMNSVENNNDSVENGGCATKSSNAVDDIDSRKYDEDNDVTQQLTQERDRPVNN